MIWLIVSVELMTFIPALIWFMAERSLQADVFQASAALLNPLAGTINTILLLTSGWLMASAITALRKRQEAHAQKFLGATIFAGCSFLVVKSFEYWQKLEAGLDLRHNDYFTFYWLLTGFHFVHVAVGVFLLAIMWFGLKGRRYSGDDYYDIETSGVFWHMCDLIWILVFPIFYLI